MADYTGFLGLGKPAKTDRINVDVINENMEKIEDFAERESIMLSETGKNISVSATGPYYTVTNNTENAIQVLLEGTSSIILDPGETQTRQNKSVDAFTLTASADVEITLTYFQRNKDYVDNSLASDLANYYDKSDSDSIFLKTLDFGNMRKEKSDSICTVDLPLKYNACGNPVEEYRIHGDTSQPATPTPASAVIPIGTGDLVTDSESEHYNEYALPIINNSIAYNVYLATPLYRVNNKSDYIDYARQKVIRNVGIITYDGSTDEAWENYEYKNYRIDLTNLGGGDNPGVSYEVLCDKLLKTSEGNLGIATDRIAICDGKVCVHFNSALTTVSEFKAYLQSNPITVYYPLASEVTEDVIMPELPTISGENQLYVNTTVTPKKVVVGALMQYLTRKDMNDTLPGLDNVYTKPEVNSMVNSLNAEVVTKAESVNDINQINGNISLTLDDVPDGDGRKMEGLATESYVNSAIGNINSFNVLVVQSLPASDIQQHTIYFVPKTPSENGDVYDEYMYINSAWEHIGTSEADLSSYYTKTECDNNFATNTHSHNYAGADSAGGSATSAKKLDNTTAIGSATQPVYFNANGVPVTTSYTVDKSVPSNAVFTDTTYNLATTSANGLMSSTDKVQVDATKIMPQSKSITTEMGAYNYKDFVIPILNIASTYSNEFFYGKIFLKRNNGAGQQMTIINLMCGKNYNEEKAVYYIDKSQMWTTIKPCSFVYNGKKMFGIHVYISASDYNILRVDARTTTDFGIITPVYIYNNNTSAVLNAEIYNSLSFFDGYNMPMNFYEIPKIIKTDGTTTKILTFSTVPASATATGTKGDIAYDADYMYVCTDANVWKRTPLTTW